MDVDVVVVVDVDVDVDVVLDAVVVAVVLLDATSARRAAVKAGHVSTPTGLVRP